MAGEKTEKATPKRQKEARKEGRVARTPDLSAWAGVLVATAIVPMVIRSGASHATDLFYRCLAMVKDPQPDQALLIVRLGATDVFLVVAPLAVSLLVLGLLANGAQGGIHLATKSLKPQLSRLNPLQGFKKIAGPHALWEAAKAILKSAVLGFLAYHAVTAYIATVTSYGRLPLTVILSSAGTAIVTLVRGAALAGLVMAGADYAVARKRIGKQTKMSRQDIKDEMRQADGDPHLKGAIRSRQMAMSRNRMMAQVATADVVLVNPTHVAVALKYEASRGAPRVVAKGAGQVAARIRAEAEANRVPMVQDIPLARTVYAACKLNQEIPPELYAAVARVLAFVLSLRRRGSAAGMHRLPYQAALAAAR